MNESIFQLVIDVQYISERTECLGVNVYVCVCVSLSHAGQAAVCATMLCDCTVVSINLDSKGSDHVCLSLFLPSHTLTEAVCWFQIE